MREREKENKQTSDDDDDDEDVNVDGPSASVRSILVYAFKLQHTASFSNPDFFSASLFDVFRDKSRAQTTGSCQCFFFLH